MTEHFDLVAIYSLLVLMILLALAMAKHLNLFTVAVISSIYSLLAAALFVVMDAVDVAFTEAAVGAGISTILILSTLARTHNRELAKYHKKIFGWICCSICGVLLFAAAVDFPAFGRIDSPAQTHVASHYIQQTASEIDLPNIVTAVLASYRGFDTFGEVVVVFTAGIAVLSLLGSGRRKG